MKREELEIRFKEAVEKYRGIVRENYLSCMGDGDDEAEESARKKVLASFKECPPDSRGWMVVYASMTMGAEEDDDRLWSVLLKNAHALVEALTRETKH